MKDGRKLQQDKTHVSQSDTEEYRSDEGSSEKNSETVKICDTNLFIIFVNKMTKWHNIDYSCFTLSSLTTNYNHAKVT